MIEILKKEGIHIKGMFTYTNPATGKKEFQVKMTEFKVRDV
jgi:hypothetical protein